MRVELKARAAGVRCAQATARVIIDPSDRAPRDAPRWIGSTVASIIGVAGAITTVPGISSRLPPRIILVLHFVATVGTGAQPLIVTIVAAAVAALEHRMRARVSTSRATESRSKGR